jgi:hypothetical protein
MAEWMLERQLEEVNWRGGRRFRCASLSPIELVECTKISSQNKQSFNYNCNTQTTGLGLLLFLEYYRLNRKINKCLPVVFFLFVERFFCTQVASTIKV